MSFNLMRDDDPRRPEFALTTPPERWIALCNGGLHAFDGNNLHRWSAETWGVIVKLAQKHDLCFVLVGSEIDYEQAKLMLAKAGHMKFPFIVCYDEPEESKAWLKYADAVISNQCTLLRAVQQMNQRVVCLRETTLDTITIDKETQIFERDELDLLDAWLASNLSHFVSV